MLDKQAIDMVLQSSPEDFMGAIKHENVTVLSNLKQALIMRFREVEMIKNVLVKRVDKAPDKDKATIVYNDLIILLKIIEDRVAILDTILNERAIKN